MQIVVRSVKGEKGVKTEDDGIQKVGFLSPSPVCRWPGWVSKYCIEILEYKEEKWCDSPVGTQCPEYYFLTFLLEYFCELLLSNWCCYSYWKAQTTRHVRCGLMGWAAVYTEKQCGVGGEEGEDNKTLWSNFLQQSHHQFCNSTPHWCVVSIRVRAFIWSLHLCSLMHWHLKRRRFKKRKQRTHKQHKTNCLNGFQTWSNLNPNFTNKVAKFDPEETHTKTKNKKKS